MNSTAISLLILSISSYASFENSIFFSSTRIFKILSGITVGAKFKSVISNLDSKVAYVESSILSLSSTTKAFLNSGEQFLGSSFFIWSTLLLIKSIKSIKSVENLKLSNFLCK